MQPGVAVPEIDPERRQHAEVYAPELLLHYLGAAALAPAAVAERLAWWERDFGRNFDRLARGSGSWNWDWMLAAVWLWRGADDAVEWWRDLLRYQLGEVQPAAGRELLGRLMGSETCSSTYEPWRWGSVLAVRLLALRAPGHPAAPEMLRLTGRYSEALSAIYALGAAPWPDAEAHVGSAGFWYTGVTVAPVGERSTLAHAYQNDLGPLWCMAAGWPLTVSKREEWPGRVARLLRGDLGVGEGTAAYLRHFVISPSAQGSRFPTLLRGLRVYSALHWRIWRGTRLTWSGPRRNFNSPKIYYSLAREETATMDCGFPWGGAGARRGKGASRSPGSVRLERGSIRVETDEGAAELALPARPPIFEASLSEQGYTEAPGAGGGEAGGPE